MSTRNIVLVVITVCILYFLSGINTIPAQEQRVQATWAEVQNDYQRRMDLIPNLVETVKGYANFEKSTLADVIQARAEATKMVLTAEQLNNPDNHQEAVKQSEQAQSNLATALTRLLAVSERYPDLKADDNFLTLQSQLEGTENRIMIARADFITALQRYNTTVVTFPGRIWAWIYGAKPKKFFMATDGASTAPPVKF